jgi:hypothetical protein
MRSATFVLPSASFAAAPRALAGTAISLLLVWLFVIGLVVPPENSLYVGSLRLSPYRVVLLIALLPCLYRYLNGQAGGFHVADALIVLHVLWATVSLYVAHGGNAAMVEDAGIYFLETAIPYFLARCYIRSAADFEALARFFSIVIICLLPWAAYESITDTTIRTVSADYPLRWGLGRAWGPFDHPILYGVFVSSMFGIVFFALQGRISNFSRYVRSGAIVAATFFSMSSGPLVGLAAQWGLAGWHYVTRTVKRRWLFLGALFLAAWIVVSILSTRTPIQVFIHYFTFNPHTSYMRIYIFDYGLQNVLANPWFGLGMNQWTRPSWVPLSVDNFWLLNAMRYGIPALMMFAGAVVLTCLRVGRASIQDAQVRNCRTGWLVSIVGLMVAGLTVHYWNATYCLFMFLLGAGVWMAEAGKGAARQSASDSTPLPAYHKVARQRARAAALAATKSS